MSTLVDHKGKPLTSALFRKATPPKIGEQFAPGWASLGKPSYQTPGGGMLLFDLDRLTLQDYRAMRNHYQINISLSLLSFMIHQVNWRIEGTDTKIRTFVEENMREIWGRFIRATSPAYWAGYAPVILQYENDGPNDRIKLTKFKDLEPENATINWKQVDGYAPPGRTKPKINVFDGIKLYPQYIDQYRASGGHQDAVPPTNCFWYPLLMEAGDHYGRKLLKPAFPSWFFSQIIHLYVNRYFERFGEPIPVGRAPFDAEIDTGDGGTISGKEAMENVLEGIRNRAIVTLPSERTNNPQGGKTDWEFSIEYLESQMRGADFERYLQRLDEEMSLGIFTPVLLYRTADVGSYNLGEAHMQIFLIMTNALVDDLAEYINRYVVRRLIDFNFGPNAGRDVHFVPKKMGEATQATLRQILLGMIQEGLAKIDVDDIGLALGMNITEVRQVTGTEDDDPTGDQDPTPAGTGGDPTDGPRDQAA